MRILFLGGAGLIGSAVAAEVVRQGHALTIVTRDEPRRDIPPSVRRVRADVHRRDELEKALTGESYDAVVNWVGFTPAHLDGHPDLFAEIADQYVYISTCSVFARPVPQLPITESSPRRQPVFGYARDKLACEEYLTDAYRADGFPLTIVRPAHTYDHTTVPLLAGWTAIDRMRSGRPVVVHGDGTSLWTLMHTSDFAAAFVPLLGSAHAIGESVNVVSGEILTWDQIHLALAAAAGVRRPVLAHRASESIAVEWPAWGEVLEHDFRHSMLFDSSKLKSIVPGFRPRISFAAGARGIIEYYDGESARRRVDRDLDAAFDRLLAR
jgi:nucleoside-diphosphate-sugar epimerase